MILIFGNQVRDLMRFHCCNKLQYVSCPTMIQRREQGQGYSTYNTVQAGFSLRSAALFTSTSQLYDRGSTTNVQFVRYLCGCPAVPKRSKIDYLNTVRSGSHACKRAGKRISVRSNTCVYHTHYTIHTRH